MIVWGTSRFHHNYVNYIIPGAPYHSCPAISEPDTIGHKLKNNNE